MKGFALAWQGSAAGLVAVGEPLGLNHPAYRMALAVANLGIHELSGSDFLLGGNRPSDAKLPYLLRCTEVEWSSSSE
jgi:hypothetical protein